MEIGKFLGITAPIAVLADIPTIDFKNRCKVLNNPVDSWVLRFFINELKYLQSFLDDSVIIEYRDTEMRKLDKQVQWSKEFYKTGIKVRDSVMSLEEISLAEAKLDKAQKVLMNRIRVGKELKPLDENQLVVLQAIYNKRTNIKRYLNCISVGTFEELSAFGEKVYRIVCMPETYLYIRAQNMFRSVKTNKHLLSSVREQCKTYTTTLKSLFASKFNQEEIARIGHVDKQALFRQLIEKGILTEDQKSFFDSLSRGELLKGMTMEAVRTLVKQYQFCKTLNEEFYNSEFGLNLTKNDYEVLFDSLDDLGLVGLNVHSMEFFEDSLNSLCLAPESKITIDDEGPLAKVILEIDELCDTLLAIGDEI